MQKLGTISVKEVNATGNELHLLSEARVGKKRYSLDDESLFGPDCIGSSFSDMTQGFVPRLVARGTPAPLHP
jgi:hypothetical protein